MLLFLFLLVITRIYAPFDQSLALIAEMFVSQVSADRMNEIYDTPAAEGSETFKPKGHDIVFDHVGFAYDKKDVLQDVSFTAREGEITALVGPSGSGKSTCARLAARLWDITRGSIKVGGVDISTVDPEVLLSDYSMVFQDVVLFDDTVMENIRLGKHGATDEEVLAAAKAANCDEFVRRLPKGYGTPIGENGAKLSGGERQRISIARALLKDAPIILLDEATASLDVENETKVQGALSRLLAGKTVLVIAHRMRTVEAADKIVVLADGKVAEQGSPSDLMEKGGLFRRHGGAAAAKRRLEAGINGFRIRHRLYIASISIRPAGKRFFLVSCRVLFLLIVYCINHTGNPGNHRKQNCPAQRVIQSRTNKETGCSSNNHCDNRGNSSKLFHIRFTS